MSKTDDWKVRHDEPFGRTFDEFPTSEISSDSDEFWIAKVAGKTDEIRISRAHLIAAAPELLEACKRIIAAYSAGKIAGSPISESNALLAFICDAANKAEGRA